MGIWDWFEQNTTVFIETCAVLVDLQFQQITHKQCNKELMAKINFYYLIETTGRHVEAFFEFYICIAAMFVNLKILTSFHQCMKLQLRSS